MIGQLGASDLIIIIYHPFKSIELVLLESLRVSWLNNEYIIFRVVRHHHRRIHGVSKHVLTPWSDQFKLKTDTNWATDYLTILIVT